MAIELHGHPRVNKRLVIRKGGYLALETHEQKDERLEVKEGGVLSYFVALPFNRSRSRRSCWATSFIFEPGMEH